MVFIYKLIDKFAITFLYTYEGLRSDVASVKFESRVYTTQSTKDNACLGIV
jgi:hypothetical protein